MKIQKSFHEVSNGIKYSHDDILAIDTRGCQGCSDCCHGNSQAIVLTPYDVWGLKKVKGLLFKDLFANHLGSFEEDKLPYLHLKTQGLAMACTFLSKEGRCQVHSHRPGICRLFPLGRVYDNQTYHYFYQEGECIKPDPSMIRIREWVGIEPYEPYRQFIIDWYQFLKALKFRVKFIRDDQELKDLSSYLIRHFFEEDFQDQVDFYPEFYKRLTQAKADLGVL